MNESHSHNTASAEPFEQVLWEEARSPRVLVARIGAMGDVLHAMSAVAALRERHPEWTIGWAIEPRWSELLQSSEDFAAAGRFGSRGAGKPLVDAWFPVATQRWRERPMTLSTLLEMRAMWRELRAAKFDLCVDMQGSIKSAVVGRMAGAKVLAGAAEPREREAVWLYGRRLKMPGEHVVEQGCALLGTAVGEPLHPAKIILPTDKAAERWCDETLAGICRGGERFVVLAPTAGWGAKQWPAARFGQVAAELTRAGFATVVNAASFGDAVALQVVEASGGAARLVPCSVGQMIALLRRAALVIAGDTGPLHLAAALERPVVGLFGPTDPARNGPWGTRAVVLRDASSRRDHRQLAETEAGLLRLSATQVVEAALGMLHDAQDRVNPASDRFRDECGDRERNE